MPHNAMSLGTSSAVHAAVSVLAQPHLLALIVSFQHGLPVTTGPLILRYLRAHLQDVDGSAPVIAAERIYDLWNAPSSLMAAHRWKLAYAVESIIKRGVESGDTARLFQDLASRLTSTMHYAKPKHARRLFLQRARAAATAFARSDVLDWLDEKYQRVRDTDPVPSRCATPINTRVASASKWRARITIEAVVALDESATFEKLRLVLHQCALLQPKPEQALRRCVHRVWEAAASLGRVDVLAWLYETYAEAVAAMIPVMTRSAALLAVRNGHASVLTWVETTFGSSAVEALRGYQMKGPVARGHLQVVRWMAQRGMGVMPVGAVYLAVAKRDVAMLGEVLAFRRSSSRPPSVSSTRIQWREELYDTALAKFARATDQPDLVKCLIEHNCAFPTRFIHLAITERDFEAAEYMLEYLHNARGQAQWLVTRLILDDDVEALAFILARAPDLTLVQRELGGTLLTWDDSRSASPESMRLLLRMSSVSDISTVLMRHAIQGRAETVERLLALVDRPLSPDVAGFVHRVVTDSLGPVASLARTYKTWTADAHRKLDNHLMETMAHWLPTASRQDARDLVLHLLPQGSQPALERVLAVDADSAAPHFDRVFVELCLSLRNSARHTEHEGIAAILRQRGQYEPRQ